MYNTCEQIYTHKCKDVNLVYVAYVNLVYMRG